MNFRLSLPDYVVVAGYFVVVLWVGFFFRKRQEAAKDYFAAGHQLPWWLAGISHYMSSFSAFSFIAYSQLGYTYGWVSVTLFWASAWACLLGGKVFASAWRRARVITPVEFVERRFNASLRQVFAWAGIPVKIFDDALKIFATGLFVAVGIGVGLHWAIIACGVVMVAYTFLGGLWALVVTDYIQFLMKTLAIVLLCPLAIWKAGGIVKGFQGLPPGLFQITGGPYGWIYVIGFIVLIGMSYNGSWALAQKYYSVPSEKDARKAAYLAAALNFFGAPLMMLPPILGRKFLPDLLAQQRTADTYVLLVLTLLPVGMIGIIVAAIFSATMATVSADLNAIASVLTKDVYQRVFNPKATEKSLVGVGRAITAVLGGLIIILGLWVGMSQKQSLFNLMVTAFGLLLAPTMLPLLAGLTVRSLTWKGALAGLLAGLASGVIMFSLKTWYLPTLPSVPKQWSGYTFEGISILVNTAVTILAMWLASRFCGQSQEDSERVREFFRTMDRPILAEEISAVRRVSPLKAIGASTVVVGGLLGLAGVVSQTTAARTTDLALGFGMVALGIHWYRKGKA